MNIFFYGGSFDPPHLGHLKMIETCLDQFDVSRFIIIPTNQSPLKKNRPFASSFHRIEMLKLLVKKFEKKIIIDDYEINKNSISYTYDTIQYLKTVYSNSCFFMVLGEDQYLNIKKWKNYKKILDIVNLIVFNRSNDKVDMVNGINIIKVKDFNFNISSSDIRRKINNCNLKINDLPFEIMNYIKKNEIYKIDDD